jgi:TonB family protein
MIAVVLLLAGLAQGSPSPLSPPPPAPHVRMVANPDWAELPDGDKLADLYPTWAARNGVSGETRMQCRVTESGELAACFILVETPLGLDFGAATLAAARYFKMRPRTVDGTPVAGGQVIIPLHWRLPSEPPPVSARDLPAARACLGWAQVRFDAEHSEMDAKVAAEMTELHARAAAQAGLGPAQIVQDRKQGLDQTPAQDLDAAREAATACWTPFEASWQLDPAMSAKQSLAPDFQLYDGPRDYVQAQRAKAEVCIERTARRLRAPGASDAAAWRAYAAWSKTFVWTSFLTGRTSRDVNDRLAELSGATAPLAGVENAETEDCVAKAALAPPD